MSTFTYESPPADRYLNAVRALFSRKHPEMNAVNEGLVHASCSIQASGHYSSVRWDGLATTIYLYVPVEALDAFQSQEVISALTVVCDIVMPKEAGFDVVSVEVSPILEELAASTTAVNHQARPSTSLQDPAKVFIVHGRDKKLLENLSELLRSVGLIPLSWEEARFLTGKPTPFTEEVVNTAFARAQAIIVLLSPDERVQIRADLASDGRAELGHQPRPNVIWEMGLAMAMHPERTVLLEIGMVRNLSDLAGRNVIRLDERNGIRTDKRQLLLSSLRSAGCTVNLNGAAWTNTTPIFPTGAVSPSST